MKNIAKLLIFGFVLLKVTGPGVTVYYGQNGVEVKDKLQAVQFNTIGEAYNIQKTVNANVWSIDQY